MKGNTLGDAIIVIAGGANGVAAYYYSWWLIAVVPLSIVLVGMAAALALGIIAAVRS